MQRQSAKSSNPQPKRETQLNEVIVDNNYNEKGNLSSGLKFNIHKIR